MRQILLKYFKAIFIHFSHLLFSTEKNVTFLVLCVIGIIKPQGDKAHSPLSNDSFIGRLMLCWEGNKELIANYKH